MSTTAKKGILERLNAGVVIGDGGFEFALEKRGYVKAGAWTCEVNIEHPDAVRQLHREFLRAGADVMQTFTFYGTEDKLKNRGCEVLNTYSAGELNSAACVIAREVADEGDALVAGGVCQTPSYLNGESKEVVQEMFRKQMNIFIEHKVDFLIAEYFEQVEEAEWAVEVLKTAGLPIAVTICVNSLGECNGVLPGECAVRLARAGGDIVGVNCLFDPFVSLETMKLMKEALDKENLKPHLMVQPIAFVTPDVKRMGFVDIPEFPFALEPRTMTRFEMHAYARQAYDMGIRYIGGCCGFEAYHIRALSEELAVERGFKPEGSSKHLPWGGALRQHTKPWVRARARRSYWENLKPASGRPYCPCMSKPENWEVTRGDDYMKQGPATTTDEELDMLFENLRFKY